MFTGLAFGNMEVLMTFVKFYSDPRSSHCNIFQMLVLNNVWWFFRYIFDRGKLNSQLSNSKCFMEAFGLRGSIEDMDNKCLLG